MSKLTLSIDAELIAEAKQHAEERNTSVSKLVSEYLEKIVHTERLSREDLPPNTRYLSGLLKGLDVDLEAHNKHREEKYL